MMDSGRFSQAMLVQFVNGELPEAQAEELLGYLAEDEAALARVDALWAEKEVATAVVSMPTLPPRHTAHMEERVLRLIHRSDLALDVVQLGTVGFVSVAVGLLRPFSKSQSKKWPKKRRQR